LGERYKIVVFDGSGGYLFFSHYLSERLIELLKLPQDLRAKLHIVVADQSYSTAKVLVYGT
jgi:hypothetical protein